MRPLSADPLLELADPVELCGIDSQAPQILRMCGVAVTNGGRYGDRAAHEADKAADTADDFAVSHLTNLQKCDDATSLHPRARHEER